MLCHARQSCPVKERSASPSPTTSNLALTYCTRMLILDRGSLCRGFRDKPGCNESRVAHPALASTLFVPKRRKADPGFITGDSLDLGLGCHFRLSRRSTPLDWTRPHLLGARAFARRAGLRHFRRTSRFPHSPRLTRRRRARAHRKPLPIHAARFASKPLYPRRFQRVRRLEPC